MTKKIVFTAGTWDLFHIGHLNIIKKSKELGDYLIVGVSTDELVMSYKKYRPFIPYDERLEIIQSIKYVDETVKQTKLIDINQLKKFNVDIVTIGDDWKTKYLEGLDWMKKQGKEVVYLPYTDGVSSTTIKQWIMSRSHEFEEDVSQK